MFDQQRTPRRRIAIVGAGISGLSAAYYLSPHHDVTLYEASSRLGGHARTVLAGRNGDQPVDTGFIVFNYVTYPYLTRLFRELDVPVIKSEMSFGASIDDGWLEYGLNNMGSILAQKRNLARPAYYRMIADIIRFGRKAEEAATNDDMTIGELVGELKMGAWFRNNYLLPMCGAIWSTPVSDVDRFPARSLVRFFRNHALLAGSGAHQWWTVKGGSVEYVRRIETALLERGCDIRRGTAVNGILRNPFGVAVRTTGAENAEYDDVVLACHTDQALSILGNGASEGEAETLGSIRYQMNRAILHCDPGYMPRRRACWSSWAYRSHGGAVSVTYWMNRLQNIPDDDPLFVTLNPSRDIPAEKVFEEVEFAHPVFDKPALQAQSRIMAMQGQNRTWFAGAYNRHGFHEDGIASAMRVVRLINERQNLKGPDLALHQQSPEVGIPVDV